jgi:hypothetical protein
MVIFLFNNTAKLDNVKKVVNVYMLFKEFCGQLVQQFGKNGYKRISDYENMAFEVMQILVQMLLCNMYIKYKSSKSFKRRDAQISA